MNSDLVLILILLVVMIYYNQKTIDQKLGRYVKQPKLIINEQIPSAEQAVSNQVVMKENFTNYGDEGRYVKNVQFYFMNDTVKKYLSILESKSTDGKTTTYSLELSDTPYNFYVLIDIQESKYGFVGFYDKITKKVRFINITNNNALTFTPKDYTDFGTNTSPNKYFYLYYDYTTQYIGALYSSSSTAKQTTLRLNNNVFSNFGSSTTGIKFNIEPVTSSLYYLNAKKYLKFDTNNKKFVFGSNTDKFIFEPITNRLDWMFIKTSSGEYLKASVSGSSLNITPIKLTTPPTNTDTYLTFVVNRAVIYCTITTTSGGTVKNNWYLALTTNSSTNTVDSNITWNNYGTSTFTSSGTTTYSSINGIYYPVLTMV